MADNKKEAFTFSDKIKNSKPAFNPFARRVSSKIGANGKPKKTIFERTKRDAPFFIAALAALLLLPFLYKYSGSIEETGIITPGSADTVFDPYRDGIGGAFLDDPDGAIAQYTGRDPLSLIQGFGSPAPEDDFSGDIVDYRVQDGLDDNYTPARPSDSPRAYAPAATRAAFQRQATKINELGSAGLNLRGGAGVPFRFGGASLKRAAQADSAGAPKQGTKPVALQPLRAADSPSRSYFGQPGAAQARASREAMGKTNAAQAVRDAMFNPARTSAGVGGLGSGTFAPGGGAGQINHTLDFKGITPWWWDMMKDRAQQAWQWKYFLWRKNFTEALVKSLGELAGLVAKNMGCCLITGNQDCDMDTFLGASPENSTESTCCGLKKKDWVGDLEKYTFDKAGCDAFVKQGKLNKNFQCTDGWKEGRDIKKKQNFFQVRAACFGAVNLGSEYAQGDPGLTLVPGIGDCEALNRTQNYSVKPEGEAMNWKTYHYLAVRNYVPINLQSGRTVRLNLCDQQTEYNISKERMAALALIQDASLIDNEEFHNILQRIAQLESDIQKADSTAKQNLQRQLDRIDADLKTRVVEAKKKISGDLRYYNNPVNEDFSDACVVYVSQDNTLHWDTDVQPTMVKLLERLIIEKGIENEQNAPALARQAFNQLDWAFIESFSSKHELAVKPTDLPMPYWQFFDYFLMRRGDNKTIADRKFRQEGVDSVRGGRCIFDNSVKFSCEDTPQGSLEAKARLSFTAAYQGGRTLDAGAVAVRAFYAPLDGSAADANEQPVRGQQQDDGSYLYSYTSPIWFQRGDKGARIQQNGAGDKAGVVTWKVYRGGQAVKTVSCDYHNEGSEPMVETVQPPQVEPNPSELPRNRDVTMLAQRITDIPSNPFVRNVLRGTENPVAPQGQAWIKLDDLKEKEKDETRLSQAYAGSQAAKTYVEKIIKAYNERVTQNSSPGGTVVEMVRPQNNYPQVPEVVDAMRVAQALGETTVPKNVVCDMARGIALQSEDYTPVQTRKGRHDDNTFGSFAIYMGNGYMYPHLNQLEKGGTMVPDYRFYCLENGRYLCTPDYEWENYIWKQTGKPQAVTQSQLAAATKEGRSFTGTYPLAALAQGPSGCAPGRAEQCRDEYVQNNSKVFGITEECELEGGMNIEDALAYVEIVAKRNGTSYKPQASNKQKGDSTDKSNIQGGSDSGMGITTQS